MPIFQDDFAQLEPRPAGRRLSEESLCTELCEGPLPDSPRRSKSPPDRVELIERLKRGQSPTWIPNRHLESLFCQSPGRPQTPAEASSLLPPAQITPEKAESPDDLLRHGLDIDRPRSALHSGDFTQEQAASRRRPEHAQLPPEDPWASTSPPRDLTPYLFGRRPSTDSFRSEASPRSSSFVYKAPTSPLVQSESNEELDLSMPLDDMDFASHRFGPGRYASLSGASSPFPSPSPRPSLPSRIPPRRREGSFPYQAHQPRRSLNLTPNFLPTSTSPPTPAFLRSRRSSFIADSPPIQHASMVGSYEESILRGRMSTNPSKPLEFLAQIGVLGKGKCKSSLRCPPHVTLSFPAVYYSYSNTAHGRSRSDDGPSPYVGQVDLENGLPNTDEEHRSKRKAQTRQQERRPADDDVEMRSPGHGAEDEGHRLSRTKRRSASPRAPPGGSYRIPEKGQIQIIIKNQNKTAVKLFLVPYDLTGMEAGTKTFVRQRSYSAGPVIDNIPPASELDSADRPILRYLVHLHICCPAKGRFYLYKSIRIVFANRVPDGKEKLRNETTWPEPRYTPYKPLRVMHPLSTSTGPAAMLTIDKANRRRSSGVPSAPSGDSYKYHDRMYHGSRLASARGFTTGNALPVDPIPLNLPRRRVDGDIGHGSHVEVAQVHSLGSSEDSRPSTKDSAGGTLYEKLNKGDVGYGGNVFNNFPQGSPSRAPEGLLSQRLRSLGVKPANPPTDD